MRGMVLALLLMLALSGCEPDAAELITPSAAAATAPVSATIAPATATATKGFWAIATPTVAGTAALSTTMTATLPASCDLPPGWVTQLVRPGDTVATLAVCTGGSVAQIRAVNCLSPDDLVFVGQTLWLPTVCPMPAGESGRLGTPLAGTPTRRPPGDLGASPTPEPTVDTPVAPHR